MPASRARPGSPFPRAKVKSLMLDKLTEILHMDSQYLQYLTSLLRTTDKVFASRGNVVTVSNIFTKAPSKGSRKKIYGNNIVEALII